MNRLTFRENDKFGVVDMNEENQDKKLYACVLKLTDYEDTELSPNDILNLKEEQKGKNKELVVKVLEEIKLRATYSKFGYMGKTEKGYYTIYAGILDQIQKELENEI